jgi:hypothetical protein
MQGTVTAGGKQNEFFEKKYIGDARVLSCGTGAERADLWRG